MFATSFSSQEMDGNAARGLCFFSSGENAVFLQRRFWVDIRLAGIYK